MFRLSIITAILVIPVWAPAQEPAQDSLSNVNSYELNLPFPLDGRHLRISSDAQYKVDLCVTNISYSPRDHFFDDNHESGDVEPLSFRLPPGSTNCITFGGEAGTIATYLDNDAHDSTDKGGSTEVTQLITTKTTASGTVTVELCEQGDQGPFDCRPLPLDESMDQAE
jgi:hypothetical protein